MLFGLALISLDLIYFSPLIIDELPHLVEPPEIPYPARAYDSRL
jgi:hypothetical protein